MDSNKFIEKMKLSSDEDEEGLLSVLSEDDVNKLKELLRIESQCHLETGDCYDTLQNEYDNLLIKYAEAENTIDKLRIESLREKQSIADNIEEEVNVNHVNFESISLRNTDEVRKSSATYKGKVSKSSHGDLVSRMNVLKGDVFELQSCLGEHDISGEMLKELIDGMNNEFEEITTDFQSLQNSIKTGNANESCCDDVFEADDLEGNLYRLGLRLEEIHEEINDQIKSSLKKGGRKLHDSQSVELKRRSGSDLRSQKDILDAEYNDEHGHQNFGRGQEESETSGVNNASNDDEEIEMNNWSSNAEDLSMRRCFETEGDDQLDPLYLSRSHSAPSNDLSKKSRIPIVQRHASTSKVSGKIKVEELPIENLSDSEEKYISQRTELSSNDSSKISIGNLKHSTAAILPRQHPRHSPDEFHPNLFNTTEDSGYIEGGCTNQRVSTAFISPFGSNPPVRELRRAFPETRRHRNTSVLESAGEKYRRRLNSLRSYVSARRVANNAESSERKPRSWVRGRRLSHNHRAHLHARRKMSDKSSIARRTAEIDSSSESNHSDEADACNMASKDNQVHFSDKKAAIRRRDLEALKNEMRNVRSLVLDLKNSVTARSRTSSISPKPLIGGLRQKLSIDDYRRDSIELHKKNVEKSSNERNVTTHLQNKQFEMLENLDVKLSNISEKLQTSTQSKKLRSKEFFRKDSPISPCEDHDKFEDELTQVNRLPDRQFKMLEDLNIKLDDISTKLQSYSQAGDSVSNMQRKNGREYQQTSKSNFELRSDFRSSSPIRSIPCHLPYTNRKKLPRCIGREQDLTNFGTQSGMHDLCRRYNINNDEDDICFNCAPVQAKQEYLQRSKIRNNLVDEELANNADLFQTECHSKTCRVSYTDNDDTFACINNNRKSDCNSPYHKCNTHMMNNASAACGNPYHNCHQGGQNLRTSLKSPHEQEDLNNQLQTYKEMYGQLSNKISDLALQVKEYHQREEKDSQDEKLSTQQILVTSLEDKLERLSKKMQEDKKEQLLPAVTHSPVYAVKCFACGCAGTQQPSANSDVGGIIADSPIISAGNTQQAATHCTICRTPTDDCQQPLNEAAPKRTHLSPKVYHHHHTIHSAEGSFVRHLNKESTDQDSRSPVLDLVLSDRVQSSLDNASLAAIQMENLTKKMLRGIVMDLFNSGPPEF